MNIFVTDSSPLESARALDDRRLIKMTLETAQLLSGMLWVTQYWDERMYRPTHLKHPCAQWAAADQYNFIWLGQHGRALGSEYMWRFNRAHKSSAVTHTCLRKIYPSLLEMPLDWFPNLTKFANCSMFKENPDTIQAYRDTLNVKWQNDKIKPKWTQGGPPLWCKL